MKWMIQPTKMVAEWWFFVIMVFLVRKDNDGMLNRTNNGKVIELIGKKMGPNQGTKAKPTIW